MSTGMIWQIVSTGQSDTENLGALFGRHLNLPATLELRADLGGGKTTFVRGLVHGLGSNEVVSSPTFTLSRIYKTKNAQVHHYDFYRLDDAGVLADQLSESLENEKAITIVEWSDIVSDVLPEEKVTLEFKMTANDAEERAIEITYSEKFEAVIKAVQSDWQEIKP